MKKNYALTLDVGTQSVRAMIFDSHGNSLAMSQIQYHQPYFSSQPGYAEQNASYYLESLCRATKTIAAAHPELMDDLIGFTITTFRDTAVLLDKDHQIIRPSILWLDQRQCECDKKYPLYKRMILEVVGMGEAVELNRKRTTSNWIQKNEPDSWSKAQYYWALSTYFIYTFTEKEVDTASSYTGHFPIDMKKGKWQTKRALTYDIFNIDTKLLPKLIPSGSKIGELSKKAAELTGLPEGLIMYAGGADKNCESLGVGCINNDIASISYGTASSIEVINKRYVEPETFCPAYCFPADNLYALEVQVYRGYWMLQWFIKNFATKEAEQADHECCAVEALLNKKIDWIPAGSEGLMLQPYWGPGVKRPLAKGVICGFADYHTKYHLYKAIIEGIGYALREGLEGIEKNLHHKVKEIRVSGGGSRSSEVCQITADIFNRPVTKVQTNETSSLGCAIIVFVSAKYYSNYKEAINSMVHVKTTFFPNESNAKIYENLFRKVYKKIYPKMKKINVNIRKFNNHK